MASVAVQKIKDKLAKPRPLFQEIEKQLEEVRRRAFELFENRGRELGHALEDWLKAEREVLGSPAAELTEVNSKYKVAMTLPGYEPKDVQVTATPSEIVVHAKAERKKEAAEEKCLWTEFRTSSVYRRFEFPEAIDLEKTTATLDKGMLHVTAPKMPKGEAKAIEVRGA